MGHVRRQTSERGPGYSSAVPVPPSQQIATNVNPSQPPSNVGLECFFLDKSFWNIDDINLSILLIR